MPAARNQPHGADGKTIDDKSLVVRVESDMSDYRRCCGIVRPELIDSTTDE